MADPTDIHVLTQQLRNMGLAVCVFQPLDVLVSHLGDSDKYTKKQIIRAEAWLRDNSKYVEEAMSTAGFQVINYADDPVE